MSLILSGTDGLSDIDGSAATPAIRGTDANTGIFFPAADTIAFSEGGAEAMRIDSSGNVGIGTNSPGYTLDVVGSSRVYSSAAGLNTAKFGASRAGDYVFLDGLCSPLASNGYSIFGMRAYSSLASASVQVGGSEWVHEGAGTDNKSYYTISTHSGTALAERMRIDSSGNVGIGSSPVTSSYRLTVTGGRSAFQSNSDAFSVYVAYNSSTNGFFMGSPSADVLSFSTAGGSERMRINSGGNLLLGNTTFTNSNFASGAAYIDSNLFLGNNGGTAAYNVRLDGFANALYVAWNNGTADVNSISYAYGGTAWVQTSDETLKDIIEPITDAANKVSTLRAVIGKFKTEEEGIRHPFLIAQDVQAVLPEAVYVNKSRVEGEPDTLGVGYTDVIPLLVAAIKEQQALILSLTTRLTALEQK